MPKFATFDEYYASLTATQEQAVRRFVDFVAAEYPQFELVLAWNQPMFRVGTKYILGFMATKNHINLATVTDTPVLELSQELAGYRHGGRTVSLPFDWQIDGNLIAQIVEIRSRELGL